MTNRGLDVRDGAVPGGVHIQGQQRGPAGIPQKSSNPMDPAFHRIRK